MSAEARTDPVGRARWAAAVVRSVLRWTRQLRPWLPDRAGAYAGSSALLLRSVGLPVPEPRYRFALGSGSYPVRIGTWHELACALEVLRDDDYVQPGLDPRTVLDLGANIGVATLLFRDRYPEAEIVAVEPASDTFALLQRNTAGVVGVSCRRHAVGPAGLVDLDPDVPPTARQPEPTAMASATTVERLPLGALLDDLGWPTVDLLKIDIEGDEFAVLADPAVDRCGVVVGELHLAKAPKGFDVDALLPGFDVELRPGDDAGYLTFRAVRRST